jgi:hypothetical protein
VVNKTEYASKKMLLISLKKNSNLIVLFIKATFNISFCRILQFFVKEDKMLNINLRKFAEREREIILIKA